VRTAADRQPEASAGGSKPDASAAGKDDKTKETATSQPAESPLTTHHSPLTPPSGAPPSVYASGLPGDHDVRILPIDLPYALHLVNASNPTIAIARVRIQQAYAELGQARVLWVPNLWLGGNPYAPTFLPTFYHHDGLIQNARGDVFFTDKNNFFLGTGAALSVPVADALFAPHIAKLGVAAAAARARAATDDVQLDVSLTYLDLLRVYGELAINDEAIRRSEELLRDAESTLKAGLGAKTPADVAQVRVEVEVRRQERRDLQGQAGIVSARLAQLLLLDATADLLPGDQTVVPIALVPADCNLDELVAVALMQRPELAEDRALIAVALARWRQARVGPLIPTLQAFYWGGDFIGGRPELKTAGGREDVTVQLAWEFRNGGLGNLFQSRERRADYHISQLRLVETQARVAAEVTAAAKMIRSQERALQDAQAAVTHAEDLWRKLRDLVFGVGGPAKQFDPIQPLLAERALREARLLYLSEVIDYNRNQFRLYWALGKPPECALPKAQPLPLETSVLPRPGTTTEQTDKDKGKDKGKSKEKDKEKQNR
jgi:outer membrane protein TolC